MKGWRASVSSDKAMRTASLLARLGQSVISRDGKISKPARAAVRLDREPRFPSRLEAFQIAMAGYG